MDGSERYNTEETRWRCVRGALHVTDRRSAFYVGKLFDEEDLKPIIAALLKISESSILHFDIDAPESRMIEVFDMLNGSGVQMKNVMIDGVTPRFESISVIEKFAKECRLVLLRGYFDPRTLNESYLFELVWITKYLLLKGIENLGVATGIDRCPSNEAKRLIGDQDDALKWMFEEIGIDRKDVRRLLKNRWYEML